MVRGAPLRGGETHPIFAGAFQLFENRAVPHRRVHCLPLPVLLLLHPDCLVWKVDKEYGKFKILFPWCVISEAERDRRCPEYFVGIKVLDVPEGPRGTWVTPP